MGYAPPEDNAAFRWYGKSWADTIDHYFPGVDQEEFIRRYRSNLESPAFGGEPIPGAREALDSLVDEHVLTVLSNRNKFNLELRAEQGNINLAVFRLIIGEGDTPYRKPDPRAFGPIVEFYRSISIDISDVPYAGDHVDDFLAANAVGMPFIAVLTGLATREDFLDAGVQPEDILPSFAGVPEYLEMR